MISSECDWGIMKRIAVLVLASLLTLAAGCDLFGTDEAKGYVTGNIYSDLGFTIPNEGVTVVVESDSLGSRTVTGLTDSDGVFMIEVVFYAEIVENESGTTSYVLPDNLNIGVKAIGVDTVIVYADLQTDPLVLSAGDTLYLWPICIPEF